MNNNQRQSKGKKSDGRNRNENSSRVKMKSDELSRDRNFPFEVEENHLQWFGEVKLEIFPLYSLFPVFLPSCINKKKKEKLNRVCSCWPRKNHDKKISSHRNKLLHFHCIYIERNQQPKAEEKGPSKSSST